MTFLGFSHRLSRTSLPNSWRTWLVVLAVLAAAFLLGARASATWLALLVGVMAALILLLAPALSLFALVLVALVFPLEISTGTEVNINPTTLLVPALAGIWLLDSVRRQHVGLAASKANLPLALFLLAGLFSLLVGNATWDPIVPRSNSFLLVQLAQWAIFAFSAGAFWLTASLVKDEAGLWRLTAFFLLLAGGVAVLRAVPGVGAWVGRFTSIAFVRAPLWILLAGLAGGQLLFNRRLATPWRLFLLLVIAAVLAYAFVQQQEATSNWLGVGVVAAALIWLRFPRLRIPIMVVVIVLIAVGVLFPAVYQFAGGDQEWTTSGGSRLVLIQRVIDVTMRNPITGLGPAAYRRYAAMEPLKYQRAFWVLPRVNSHNNYVDLFSHTGLVGLALFGWFVAEIGRLGMRLHRRYVSGFAAGYANGMLAIGLGALAIMVLADWILPFVYNIGFPGFQASVLVWLFMGGLVALDNMGEGGRGSPVPGKSEGKRE